MIPDLDWHQILFHLVRRWGSGVKPKGSIIRRPVGAVQDQRVKFP